jgi:hypothetical protein
MTVNQLIANIGEVDITNVFNWFVYVFVGLYHAMLPIIIFCVVFGAICFIWEAKAPKEWR